jgi:RimJ/RimL family protein N-acetyltransferase
MHVRRATIEDSRAFAAVIAAVAEERRWIATEPPVDVAAFAERVRNTIANGNDPLWVLEDEGRIIGSLGLHATAVAGVATLGMSIVEPARGKGGGRALLQAAMAHALNSSLHKVELEVWPDNERAIALYESCGFEREGERRDHYRRRDGSLRSSVIMARLLERERAAAAATATGAAAQSRPSGGT